MKFSIIIPVYNVEKYISKCLESIKKQTYDNFEVIIVNDGSPDGSQKIIDEFVKKDNRFHSYKKENGGLSDARNFGLNYVTGDCILFIDSDDYIEEDLLNELSKIDSSYDMVKFKIKLVDEEGSLIRTEQSIGESSEISLEQLLQTEFFEPAWTYLYKASFFKENDFRYAVGRIHEDFGLTPLCVLKAKKIYYLNNYGYCYVQRQGSIMSASKVKKRIEDMLFHFDNLKNSIHEKDINKEHLILFRSFLANGLINVSKIVPKEELDNYIVELKKRNVGNFLSENTLKRKMKKMFFRSFPKLYLSLLRGQK